MSYQAFSQELKNKLQSHKKWIEEQLNSTDMKELELSLSGPEKVLQELANSSPVHLEPYNPSNLEKETQLKRKKKDKEDFSLFDGHDDHLQNIQSARQEKETAQRNRSKVAKPSNTKTPVRQREHSKNKASNVTPSKNQGPLSPKKTQREKVGSAKLPKKTKTIEVYGRLSGDKKWDNILIKNQEFLENKKEYLERRKLETEADEECTFKPKTNTNFQLNQFMTFDDRNKAWLAHREQLRELKLKQDENRGLEECTFRPHINPPSSRKLSRDPSDVAIKGVENHVMRQLVAQNSRENLLASQSTKTLPKSSSTAKLGSGLTIPKSPILRVAAHDSNTVKALQLPLNPEYLDGFSSARVRSQERERKCSTERHREETYAQKLRDVMDQKGGECVQIKDVNFHKAKTLLHQELHSFNIQYD